ncbi:MAG: YidC/Oxa1 family membrane protein insertase [Clostridia bacterium]|nr:YidC/Oxa1 family membrane protein insertase [Clostridia bacterium]
MLSYIMMGLGWILNLFYELIGNYGVTIILFTIFIKLALFPLDLKQRRSMARTQKIQPLLMEVQKKYANDKERLNQETMKLYQKYGINPMGGCLPMLIQFPIIIALYWVVRKPIVYMMGVNLDETWRIAEAFSAWASSNMDLLPETLRNAIPLTYEKSMSNNTFGMNEIQIAQMMHQYPEVLDNPLISQYWDNLKTIDFSFFGMNLADTPSFGALAKALTGNTAGLTLSTALLWIIPILSGASSFLSSFVLNGSNKTKQEKNIVLAENEKPQNNAPGADSMKSMTYIMPLFSAWFAFTLPAAIGLYWTISNIIQIVQQLLVKKMFSKDISLEELEGDINNVKSRKKRKNSR